jgi:hypothetical protein
MFFDGRKCLAVRSVVLSMVLTCTAEAATLSAASGSVYVDAGLGYRPAQINMDLAAGDTVMVSVGSTAMITFEECTIPIEFGEVFVVPAENPCGKLTKAGFDSALVLGTIAIAGGVAAAVALAGSDDGDPVSAGGGGGGAP